MKKLSIVLIAAFMLAACGKSADNSDFERTYHDNDIALLMEKAYFYNADCENAYFKAMENNSYKLCSEDEYMTAAENGGADGACYYRISKINSDDEYSRKNYPAFLGATYAALELADKPSCVVSAEWNTENNDLIQKIKVSVSDGDETSEYEKKAVLK